MRVFYAITFSEEIKDKLFNIEDRIKNESRSGNFTLRENIHLTLKFIGEAENDDVKSLGKALNKVGENSFEIEVNRVGEFSRGESSILWIGIQRSIELQELFEKLEEQLLIYGWEKETKKYTPHITIGRKVKCNSIKQFKIEPFKIKIEKIALMESKRINGKLQYIPIVEKLLKDK